MFAGELGFGPSQQIQLRWSDRATGDFALTAPGVEQLRRDLFANMPVAAPQQVHGVHVAAFPDEFVGVSDVVRADAIITTEPNVVLSVITADCAPIALWTNDGVIAVVHAGWKGLLAGVVEQTVEKIRVLTKNQTEVFGWLGPCIHPECYEFGREDLDRLIAQFGPGVEGRTSQGRVAFDLPSAVASAFHRSGITDRGSADQCTACDERWFSWRARQDTGRQGLFLWVESGT